MNKENVTVNIDGLEAICQAWYKDLYQWMKEQLTGIYGEGNVIAQNGYIFCTGNIRVGLCAHLDTVFREQPKEFVYDSTTRKLSSPQGIGGDDRCGVYAILKILSIMEGSGKYPYLFFSTDEETGGSTTRKACTELKDKVSGIGYLIQLDRQGEKDSVYYECDNREFKKWIDAHGFVEAKGSNTDICKLCDAWDIAGVNFSVGYMENHTSKEVVTIPHLESTIEKVLTLIEDTDDKCDYRFCKKTTGFGGYSGRDYWGGDYLTKFLPKDSVKTKNPTTAFVYGEKKTTPSGEVVEYVNIPGGTHFIVEAVFGKQVSVKYNGKITWIYERDLAFNYSK